MNGCRIMPYFLEFWSTRLLVVVVTRKVALRGEGFLRIPDIDFNNAYSSGTGTIKLRVVSAKTC